VKRLVEIRRMSDRHGKPMPRVSVAAHTGKGCLVLDELTCLLDHDPVSKRAEGTTDLQPVCCFWLQ